MLYNIDYSICSLLFLAVLILFFFQKENLFQKRAVCFGVMLILCLGVCVLDILTSFFISYPTLISTKGTLLLLGLLYAFNTAIPIAFFMYIVETTGAYKLKSRFLNVVMLPGAILTVSLAVNIFTQMYFGFDSNMQYYKTSWVVIFYVAACVYTLFALIIMLRHRKHIDKREIWAVVLGSMVVLAGMFIQYLYPKYTLSSVTLSLGLMVVFLTVQNPQELFDKLTGLYGRDGFIFTCERMRERKCKGQIIVVDINGLKNINELLGVAEGDRLIVQIAEYLRRSNASKQVYRIAGVQFAMIVSANAHQKVEELTERFNCKWSLKGAELRLSANIMYGEVSCFASEANALMPMVENVVALAKRMGSGTVLCVDEKVMAEINRRIRIEHILWKATVENGFEVYYQPIMNTATGKADSAEALLRLFDGELGYVPPDEFITIAEQKGMINQIGDIVLRRVCEFICSNQPGDYGVTNIHVNLSPIQCLQDGMAERLISIMNEYDIPKNSVCFEITETAIINSQRQVESMMETLTDYGVQFAMDDYGNGYFNSDTLISLPFDMVKLDKSMLWSCSVSKARIVFTSTINMLKELNLKIVAEGAENPEHIEILSRAGVKQIQGYYYSRPLNQEKYLNFIKTVNF